MTNRLSQLRIKLDQMGKIARDESGNIMWITAFSLFPMIGLIGSGVDMSRAYMAKTRLQAACDAGALAGRKAMGDTGTYDRTAQDKADKMFHFNYNSAANGSSNITYVTQAGSDGQVTGTASATVNTLVMRIFNRPTIDITANCKAELQIANTDVMFVLDTTGSMDWCPNGDQTACRNLPTARIQGMRDAVADFHKTIAAAVTNDAETRIRYAFVPYTSTVNVGGMISNGNISANLFASQARYQTKLAQYDTPIYTVTNTTQVGNPTVEVYTDQYNDAISISNSQCTKYANNWGDGNPVVITAGPRPGTDRERVYSNAEWGYSGAPDRSGTSRSCRRTATERDVTYDIGGYKFTQFIYRPAIVNTSDFRNGSATIATGTGGTVQLPGVYTMEELPKVFGASGIITANTIWNGCVEDRSTVQDFAMNPIPAGATDLDIVSSPTDEATRWKPMWNTIEYNRGTQAERTDTRDRIGLFTEYCPEPAQAFRTVSTVDATTIPTWLDTYLKSIEPWGGTYHDIGMIWGARLASTRGINATNVNEGNVNGVGRHIIFMTDGEMAPSLSLYGAYGVEGLDNRIAPAGTSEADPTSATDRVLANYHNNRFLAACARAKAEGYIVWTVAFGMGVTNELRQCSTDNRAYSATDTAQLRAQFQAIATQIADLRLSQ